MKRDKSDSYQPKRSSSKRHAMDLDFDDEKPSSHKLQNNKITPSLSTKVFQMLDWLSIYLNSNQDKMLDEVKLNEIVQLLEEVKCKMTLEQMYHLEYSNRLHYLRKSMARRNFKAKNWVTLQELITAETERVEKYFFSQLQNIDSLLSIKHRYESLQINGA